MPQEQRVRAWCEPVRFQRDHRLASGRREYRLLSRARHAARTKLLPDLRHKGDVPAGKPAPAPEYTVDAEALRGRALQALGRNDVRLRVFECLGEKLPYRGLYVRIEDLMGAVVFLASEMASYITGQTIGVDGGTAAGGGWYHRPGSGEYVLGPS